MRLFIRQILFFCLPVVLLLGVVLVWPQDKKAAYTHLQDYCRNAEWAYHRIFESDTPVDIALMGTSMTMCAVNDSLLETLVNSNGTSNLHVANLGYCRPGRNMQYALLQDLLKQKKPKWIILEATVKEPFRSHPQFPLVADTPKLLFPVSGFHDKYIPDLVKALESRLKRIKNVVTFSIKNPDSADINRSHSYTRAGADRTMSQWERQQPQHEVRTIPEGSKGFVYDWDTRFPKIYVEEMVALAKANGAEVAFLYLPSFYAHPSQLPMEKTFLEQNGEIWTGPQEVFKHPDNWMDHDHLNFDGANQYTTWLADQLKEKLYEGK